MAGAAGAARAADAYGAVYGLFTVSEAAGALVGPSAGSWMYERIGALPLTLVWGAGLLCVTIAAGIVSRRAPDGSEAQPQT